MESADGSLHQHSLHHHHHHHHNHHHHLQQQENRGEEVDARLATTKLDLGDQQQYLMAVYLFMKQYVGGYSGSSTVVGGSGTGVTPIDTSKLEPIDNKIEQAMDLVKSHLLLAVREEVDVLKTSISRLTERIGCLERENDLLRLNVPSDVLQQLDTKQCHQSSSSTTITPAPPSISNNNTAAGVVPMLASSMSVAAGETTPADSHTPSITDISPA